MPVRRPTDCEMACIPTCKWGELCICARGLTFDLMTFWACPLSCRSLTLQACPSPCFPPAAYALQASLAFNSTSSPSRLVPFSSPFTLSPFSPS